MRTRSIWLGVCSAVLLIAATAPAASITGNGTLSDWFDIAPSSSNTYEGYDLADDIYQYIDDPNGITLNGPGGGGQQYDAEAFLYTYDYVTGNFYVGLVTGFNPAGLSVNIPANPWFSAGDLFLDFDGGGYDMAIGLASDLGRTGVVYDADYSVLGSTQSVYYDGPDPDHTEADPYLAITDDNTKPDSDATVNYIDLAGTRWFYEICIENLGYNPLAGAGVGLHWTMECGNDYINTQAVVPVPAAAPIALIGLVMIGVARRVRRHKS